jgi:hypothetical protein
LFAAAPPPPLAELALAEPAYSDDDRALIGNVLDFLQANLMEFQDDDVLEAAEDLVFIAEGRKILALSR